MDERKEGFRKRLEILVGKEKPYSWCKEAKIEKGLFQYYWQKGNTPSYKNLLKIHDHTGCSLDWLLTGKGEPFPNQMEIVQETAKQLIKKVDRAIYQLRKRKDKLKNLD